MVNGYYLWFSGKKNKIQVLVKFEINDDTHKKYIETTNIVDMAKAKYYTNKMKIIEITDELGVNYSIVYIRNVISINKKKHRYKLIEYKIGDIVDDEDNNLQYYIDLHLATDNYYNVVLNNYNGIFRRYYDSGQIWSEFNYINGKIHGKYNIWYENGQFDEIGHMYGNTQENEYKKWDEFGNLIIHEIYKNNIKIEDKLNNENNMIDDEINNVNNVNNLNNVNNVNNVNNLIDDEININ
jgi:antitoxin component YwqK of YwqJK toxin-antitoxin module